MQTYLERIYADKDELESNVEIRVEIKSKYLIPLYREKLELIDKKNK